ncbi:MAG: NAD-dependent epimerase/dehydratase family protein [Nitrospira sp.]
MKDSSITRVLITGGAGFLGSHLCERFHSCDFFIRISTARKTSTQFTVGYPETAQPL